jgi:hypothetical protein
MQDGLVYELCEILLMRVKRCEGVDAMILRVVGRNLLMEVEHCAGRTITSTSGLKYRNTYACD